MSSDSSRCSIDAGLRGTLQLILSMLSPRDAKAWLQSPAGSELSSTLQHIANVVAGEASAGPSLSSTLGNVSSL